MRPCRLVRGASLYIPQAFDDQHAIARVVGARAFARLVAEWGGQTICLPMDYQREINRRDRLIGALLHKGYGTREVARIAMLSERQVQYIRQRLERSNLLPLIIKDAGAAAMALDSIQEA